MKQIQKCQKYPFLNTFVKAMASINAAEYVTSSSMDLKTLLVFFEIYIESCNKVKGNGLPLDEDNILEFMTNEYEIWRLDSINYTANRIKGKEINDNRISDSTNNTKQIEN